MFYGEEKYDVVGKMMEYELGVLPKRQAVELFQHLINTGIVWQMQARYARTAATMIEKGECQTAAAC